MQIYQDKAITAGVILPNSQKMFLHATLHLWAALFHECSKWIPTFSNVL